MLKNIVNFISFFRGSVCFDANPEFIRIKGKALQMILLGGTVEVSPIDAGKELVVELAGKVSMRIQKSATEFQVVTYQKRTNKSFIQKQKETLCMLCDTLSAQVSTRKVCVENSFDSTYRLTSRKTVDSNLFSTTGKKLSTISDVDYVDMQAKFDSSLGKVCAHNLKYVLTPEELEDMVKLGDAIKIVPDMKKEKILLP